MTQYVFGTGQLFAMPVGGGAPLRFGALQDVSVDFSGDVKQLFGQYQYALDTARGKTKIEWKAASGNIDVNAFNTIFFGQTVATGDELIQVKGEALAIPATPGPYTATVTHGADFYQDLGVRFSVSGLSLKQVATSPSTGQYSVSTAGVYTFAAADQGKGVLVDYLYESSATGGTLEVANVLMGTTPKFMLILTQVYDGKTFTLVLYKNVTDKLSLPLKQDDYLISDFSGQSMADDTGRICRITTTSIAGGGA